MNTSRFCAAVVTMLATFAAGHAQAEEAVGTTVRLDSVNKVWLNGDNVGIQKVGKLTGAGYMDATVGVDRSSAAKAAYATGVTFATTFTRSDDTKNQNAANDSYLQGGYSIGKITETGVTLGPAVNFPKLQGDRAWSRPLVSFTNKYAVFVAASEDNVANNGNPRPVLFLVDKATGLKADITNNNRNNQNRPFDLIKALQDAGINVQNANNQRGPHSIVPISDTDFLVTLQYNNQAVEAMRISVSDAGAVTAKWIQRYTDDGTHSRARGVVNAAKNEGFVAAIECNNQPADIGLRISKINLETGKATLSKIVVRSQPNQNKYVAEPEILDLDDGTLALGFVRSTKARANRNGNNGHAGGTGVSSLMMFSKTDLNPVGTEMLAPSAHTRHPSFFVTHYGGDEKPAIAAISGSSTGQSRALLQMIPYETQKLGTKDPGKLYPVSTYSDVANLQARGKRNPNNQAKGFIYGEGDVPNPGYGKPGGFYAEVKSFSISSVTGYSGPEAATKGLKESIYLSLIPSTWKPGLKTVPGQPSETAGTGPAPTTTAPPTDESTDGQSGTTVTEGEETTNPEYGNRGLGNDSGGCNVSSTGSSPMSAGAALGLALAAMLVIRRKKESV